MFSFQDYKINNKNKYIVIIVNNFYINNNINIDLILIY